MKPLDHVALFVVLAAMANLGARPTWVSAAALIAALIFYAADRIAGAYRLFAERQREHSLVVAKYGVDVQELRAEIKHVSDAVKAAESKIQMAKRSVF